MFGLAVPGLAGRGFADPGFDLEVESLVHGLFKGLMLFFTSGSFAPVYVFMVYFNCTESFLKDAVLLSPVWVFKMCCIFASIGGLTVGPFLFGGGWYGVFGILGEVVVFAVPLFIKASVESVEDEGRKKLERKSPFRVH